jgi:hypothetical protein
MHDMGYREMPERQMALQSKGEKLAMVGWHQHECLHAPSAPRLERRDHHPEMRCASGASNVFV